MVIYTKRGDKGETSLYDSQNAQRDRVSKATPTVKAIGAVDELNSFLGVAASFSEFPKITSHILEVQRDLLTVGSILAGSDLKFYETKTKKLERVIDELEGSLPVLKNFILPGGSRLSSHLQYCRTLARRAERELVALNKQKGVKSQILTFINRLSDFLFMLAREANHDLGIVERVWRGKDK